MREQDRDALATIALVAAFSDGHRGPEEVEQLKRIARDIGGGDYDTLARKVLSGQASLPAVVASLSDDDARARAYELALCVVNADGQANEREKAFLDELRAALKLDPAITAAADLAASGIAAATAATPEVTVVAAASSPAAQDDAILKTAMLTAALELLPQNLATLAIVPLQLRMVYQIGKDHGQTLDMNQVKDLAGVMGIGAAGQVMEGVARKVLGGLASGILGRMLGGVAGGVAGAAAGVTLTFATTYALGHAARQYYAQGRQISGDDLRALFAKLRDDAKGIYPRVESEIRAQAQHLNLQDVVARIRG